MSILSVEPYLRFNGCTEEALKFYEKVLGAKILFSMRYSDGPPCPDSGPLPPELADRIMHSLFQIGETKLMASDGCGEDEPISGISLALNVSSMEEADEKFAALAEGGHITMPLDAVFFSPRFGMVKDRFGVHWLVGYHPDQA